MPFANLTTNADVDDANASEHQCRLMRLTNGEEHAQLFACTSLFAAWGGILPNCTLPYGDIVSWMLEFGELDPSVDGLVWNSTYIGADGDGGRWGGARLQDGIQTRDKACLPNSC